jgi:hypothetical protein
MLQKLGFPNKWMEWAKEIQNSASLAILLNGVPGKTFQCKRGGVKQGGPLSPLLFVLAVELLKHIINRASHLGLFQHPLDLSHTSDFPVIQYVDDTILVMRASQHELYFLRGILQTFSQSTGLKVNFVKSWLLPINISNDKAEQLAGVFGCLVGSYPFTYLTLPMGTIKPKVEDYTPMINKIERRITVTTTWLTIVGRTTLVDTTTSYVQSTPCATSRCMLQTSTQLTNLENMAYGEDLI